MVMWISMVIRYHEQLVTVLGKIIFLRNSISKLIENVVTKVKEVGVRTKKMKITVNEYPKMIE